MSSCANSHDRDEVCADCDPARSPVRERPGPPVPRDRGLDHVHELREHLAGIEGYPPVPIDDDPNEEPTP